MLRSWKKQPLSLPWPSAYVACPGPPPWPFHTYCPMSFPWPSALNAPQPLSQGLLPVGWPQPSLPWQCLCQGVLATFACYILFAMVLCLYMLSNFSTIVLWPWWLHNPGAMDLCSCELPRPPGSKECLITLFSSGVVPSPSPKSLLSLPVWAAKTLSHPVLLRSSHRIKNVRFSYSFVFFISLWFSASG